MHIMKLSSKKTNKISFTLRINLNQEQSYHVKYPKQNQCRNPEKCETYP